MDGSSQAWGEENVPENALSRKFLDPSKRASVYRKNRALTPEGGSLFGRGVIREVFHPPLFSTPPWAMASSEEQSQKFKVMKLEILGVKNVVDFWWTFFCQCPPGKIGSIFVTGNFATFFTARKESCHLELTLGASSPKMLRCSQFTTDSRFTTAQ